MRRMNEENLAISVNAKYVVVEYKKEDDDIISVAVLDKESGTLGLWAYKWSRARCSMCPIDVKTDDLIEALKGSKEAEEILGAALIDEIVGAFPTPSQFSMNMMAAGKYSLAASCNAMGALENGSLLGNRTAGIGKFAVLA